MKIYELIVHLLFKCLTLLIFDFIGWRNIYIILINFLASIVNEWKIKRFAGHNGSILYNLYNFPQEYHLFYTVQDNYQPNSLCSTLYLVHQWPMCSLHTSGPISINTLSNSTSMGQQLNIAYWFLKKTDEIENAVFALLTGTLVKI